MTHGLFETLLGVGADGRSVALYDVVNELPAHVTKRYARRSLEDIHRIYVHHSGRLGAPGFQGLRNSARYTVKNRGWPGIGYHVWLPFADHFDADGRRVVYRSQSLSAHTFHAGQGPNRKGVAVCLQGNLTARDMSDAQVVALPVTLRWLAHELGISPVPLGHFQVGADGHAKAACPGRSAKSWCLGFQAAREAGGNSVGVA